MTASNNTHRKHRGFTFVEVLIVFAILVLLLGMGIVAIKKILEHKSITETKAVMATVMDAVQAYKDDTDSWPGNNNPWQWTERLAGDLMSNNEASKIFVTIPKDRIVKDDGDGNNYPEGILDGFDMKMLYSKDQGLGKTPVLVSAGRDGGFGPGYDNKSDSGDASDNIRSDQVD